MPVGRASPVTSISRRSPIAPPFPVVPSPFLAAFGPVDWAVLGAYMALMLGIGLVAAWRESRDKSDTEEFFLGGRSMPTWALAISIVGSSLSAATFIGAPDYAYGGNLSYLILNVGGFVAVFVVGALFVPTLYRAGTVTIYGFLAQRFGEPARIAVSCAFLFGRMLASGARLMLVGVPLCMLIFGVGEVTRTQMILAICIVGFVGTFYTVFGGIKTVIWVDVIQFVLVVGAALLTIGLLLNRIPLDLGGIVSVLNDPANTADGSSKLKVWETTLDPKVPFTIWTALGGSMLIGIAAFGVDHDLAQRFLVAKSPAKGTISVIASQFVSVAVVSLFMILGLLLFIYYKRPDVMGTAWPGYAPEQNQAAYQQFMLRELPTFVSGLAVAGLFAVAQGSMDSAINALASSVIADVYLPLRRMRRQRRSAASGFPVVTTESPEHGPITRDRPAPAAPADVDEPTDAPKWAVAGMGLVMTLFAIACVFAYDPKGSKGFLQFALGVMTFAFSGMLGVFFTALFTNRGSNASVIAALVTGVVSIAAMQDWAFRWITEAVTGTPRTIAYTWAMPIATLLAFVVCMAGAPARRTEPAPDAVPAEGVRV